MTITYRTLKIGQIAKEFRFEKDLSSLPFGKGVGQDTEQTSKDLKKYLEDSPGHNKVLLAFKRLTKAVVFTRFRFYSYRG